MSTKVEIISASLVMIGANAISDLSEGNEGLIASTLYETVYRGLLASHSWRFATKKARLSRLTEEPLNEWSYQFQLPTDCITVFRVIDDYDYEIYGDRLLSDVSDVYIDYRYRVDESNLPDYYILALQFLLAYTFAVPITDNSQRASTFYQAYLDQLARAKNIDSSSRPANTIIDPITPIM